MERTNQTKLHIIKGGGENIDPAHGDASHMDEFAKNRIRMLQAERTGILASIQKLMDRDEELLAQIEQCQRILGQKAFTLYSINGGKES